MERPARITPIVSAGLLFQEETNLFDLGISPISSELGWITRPPKGEATVLKASLPLRQDYSQYIGIKSRRCHFAS
jgi:hypothetical protein